MLDFKKRQAEIFDALRRNGARGFVRICTQNDALWVSDCPRRTPDLSEVEKELAALGVSARLDVTGRLWYLDLTESAWAEMLDRLPAELPNMPQNEKLHPAYALCRLWLLHPHREKALAQVRTMWKWMNAPDGQLLAAVQSMHEEASCALREGRPCGYEAGRLLAFWLEEQRKGLRK